MKESSKVAVLRLTEEEARKYLGDEPLGMAKTVIASGQIIIDSDLSPDLQDVLEKHEKVQLKVIEQCRQEGRPLWTISHIAHRAGVSAGKRLARERGVLEEYSKHVR